MIIEYIYINNPQTNDFVTMAMQNYITLREAEKKERQLEQKAGNFEDFGTLTSLGASALWFAEGAFCKTIPKTVHVLSLSAVSVGIGAVIYAFKLHHAAKKVALNDDELLLLRNPATATPTPEERPKWTDRQSSNDVQTAQR